MDTALLSWYIALLIGGLMLIIAEIFVPGGIVGILGGLAMIAAMGVGFKLFPDPWGVFSAIAIVALGGLFLLLWIRFFPKSKTGKRITLQLDVADYKSTPPPPDALLDATGVSVSPLRPGGIALINGKRIDVIANGSEWIDTDHPIRVTAIRDGNIMVSPVETAPPAP